MLKDFSAQNCVMVGDVAFGPGHVPPTTVGFSVVLSINQMVAESEARVAELRSDLA